MSKRRATGLIFLGGGLAAVGGVLLAWRKAGSTTDDISRALAGKPLHTLEQHMADPIAHPYVSVSGDDSLFPYGQRLALDVWPGLIFRVVDTGSHFRGINKVYRAVGREPLDVDVNSSKTIVPKEATATIYPGDNFAGGKAVATSGFKDQTVLGEDKAIINALAAGDMAEVIEMLKRRA